MDLESRALTQFDRLVENKEILWDERPVRFFAAEPFGFQFWVAQSLKKKPLYDHPKPKRGAFSDDDPDFELGQIGPRHRLILNKFCAIRPQFVLPTLHYELQSDPLNMGDFEAAWNCLSALGGVKYIAIFNCGEAAGATVSHKHLQIYPKPDHLDQRPFVGVHDRDYRSFYLPGVLFQHAISSISRSAKAENLLEQYIKLLQMLRVLPGSAHNMILTDKFLMVIPRSRHWIDGFTANAAAMVGMVLCNSEEQYEGWMRLGPTEALKEFGLPWEAKDT